MTVIVKSGCSGDRMAMHFEWSLASLGALGRNSERIF